MSIELAALNIPIRATGREAVREAFREIDGLGKQVADRFERVGAASAAAGRQMATGAGSATTATRQASSSSDLWARSLAVLKTQQTAAAAAAAQLARDTASAAERQRTSANAGERMAAVWGITARQGDAATGAGRRMISMLSAHTAAARAANAGNEAFARGLATITAQANAAATAQANLRREANAAGLAARNSAAQSGGGMLSGLGGRLLGPGGGAALTSGVVGGLVGGGAVGLALSTIRNIGEGIENASIASDAYEASLRKLNATSKITGVALSTIVALARDSERQFKLSTPQAADFTTNIIRLTNQAGQVEKSAAVMKAFLDLAAARGLTAAEAMQALETTIIGQDEGLNKLGLSNPQQIYEKWARAANTTAAKLNETQKWLAIVNELTTVGAKVNGEYAKSLDSSAGRAETLARAQESWRRELGLSIQPARDLGNSLRTWSLEKYTAGLQAFREALAQLFPKGGLAGAIQNALTPKPAGAAARTPTGLPELTATGTTADGDKQIAAMAEALELGTATNKERRQALALIPQLATLARDETLSLEVRNKALGQMETLLAAVRGRRAEEIEQLGALEAAHLLTETDDKRIAQLSREVEAALRRENVTRTEKLRLLREQAALQAILASRGASETMRPGANRTAGEGGTPNQGDSNLNPAPVPDILKGSGADPLRGLRERILKALEDAEQLAKEFQQALSTTFADAITAGLSAGFSGKGIGGIFAGFGRAILAGLGSIFTQMGTAMIAASPLFKAIGKAMTNPFTAGPALALYGVALVALGASLGAIAQGIGGGGGGGGGRSGGIVREDQTVERTLPPTRTDRVAKMEARTPINVTFYGRNDPAFENFIGETMQRFGERKVG